MSFRRFVFAIASCLVVAVFGFAQEKSASPSDKDTVALALNLLKQAAKPLEESNQEFDKYAWSELALAAARAKDWDLCLKANARSFRDSDSVAAVAIALMQDGKKKQAYEVIDQAWTEPPFTAEMIAYRELIDAQSSAGDLAGARETLLRLQKAAGTEHAYLIEVDHANQRIAKAAVKSENLDSALRSADSIKDGFFKANAQIAIAIAQAEKGDRAAAAKTLISAEQSLNQMRDLLVEPVEFAKLAQAHARIGDFSEAFAIVKKLPSKPAQVAFGLIAYEQWRAGNTAAALQTIQRLNFPNDQIEVLKRIAHWQLQNHDNTGALQTCRKALEIRTKTRDKEQEYFEELTTLAIYESEAGDSQLSAQTFRRALNDANKFAPGDSAKARHPGEPPQCRECVLNLIATAQAKSGDFDGAKRTVALISEAPFGTQRIDALASIAAAQAERKQFADALQTILSACPAEGRQPSCEYEFLNTLSTLARLGDERDAIEWANQRSSLSLKGRALVSVAQGILDRVYPSDYTVLRRKEIEREVGGGDSWEEF